MNTTRENLQRPVGIVLDRIEALEGELGVDVDLWVKAVKHPWEADNFRLIVSYLKRDDHEVRKLIEIERKDIDDFTDRDKVLPPLDSTLRAKLQRVVAAQRPDPTIGFAK